MHEERHATHRGASDAICDSLSACDRKCESPSFSPNKIKDKNNAGDIQYHSRSSQSVSIIETSRLTTAPPTACDDSRLHDEEEGESGSPCYEVIAAVRPFRDANWDPIGIYKRCTPKMKKTLLHLGVCHYVTAFRNTSDGTITTFDFGPVGADVGVSLKRGKSAKPGTFAGEVREVAIQEDELPENHVVVGRTKKSLNEIRDFNEVIFNKEYRMNVNDCRHYVNAVCSYCIGVADNWTFKLVKGTYKSVRRTKKKPSKSKAEKAAKIVLFPIVTPLRGLQDASMTFGQHFFEASNFRNFSFLSRSLFAAAMTLSSVRTCIKAPAISRTTSNASLVPASRFAPLTTRAPQVVKASGMLATASCVSEGPLLFVGDAIRLGGKVGEGIRVGTARIGRMVGKLSKGVVTRCFSRSTVDYSNTSVKKVVLSARNVANLSRKIPAGAVRGVRRGVSASLSTGASGLSRVKQKFVMIKPKRGRRRDDGNGSPSQLTCV